MLCCPSILLFTQSSRRFRSMFEQRRKLPAWKEQENILDLLDRCQVLVVSGMTGWVTQGSIKENMPLFPCSAHSYLSVTDMILFNVYSLLL